MLQIQNVTKRFNKTTAADNLNFEVPKNSIFGLLGPNGAGKTTTIRMIMNIIKPDSGKILYYERSLRKEDYKRVGYLPEERGLYQKMKLRETIAYFAQLKGLSAKEAIQKTNEFLDRFDLTNYTDRKIEELSKGNQQKVQFIISIIHNPDLLILDEPFAGLDPVNQLVLKDIIKELRNNGSTIIFSTHQMEQVEKLCEQICLINKGKIVLLGNLKKIKEEYGARQVRIEFQGYKASLESVQTLKNLQFDNSSITGEIPKNITVNDILTDVMNKVTITHFQLIEPSLEQIFIDQVKGET
jgi:ABC-2 type transport system ATP-binding protein